MPYFIIHSGDDGIAIHGPLDADEVSDRITPEDGANYYGTEGFHSEVPPQSDGHFWTGEFGAEDPSEKLLIIKGEVVVPRAVERVVEYAL